MHSLKQLIYESVSRHAAFYKATDGKWYMELADREYGEREEANAYGPFSTMEKAIDYLDQFSNPGGWSEDDSGTRPPPTKGPNGRPVIRPGSSGGSSFGSFSFGRGFGGYGGGYSSSRRSTARMSDEQLRNRISDIIHDYGDEYGWDRKPDVQFVLDDLADQTRKEDWDYDSAKARQYAEEALGVKKRSAAPAPAARPAAQPTSAPAAKATAAAKGAKTTYKVYSGTGTGKAVVGRSPIHTRVKGKIYAPTKVSRFKAGSKVDVEPVGTRLGKHTAKLSVRDVGAPPGQNTQIWDLESESLEPLIRDFVRLVQG